jgi:hypothetical protein
VTAAKRNPKAPRKRASGANAAEAGQTRNGESTAEKRAREKSLIEAAVQAGRCEKLPPGAQSSQAAEELEHVKRGLQSALGHDEDGGAEQWKKDRAAVWKALGHDVNGKCPADIDWKEDFRKVPEMLRDAHTIALTRAWCHFPLAHSLVPMTNLKPAALSPCGWWWCADKDRLQPEQWSDLLKVVEILKERGIDPNGYAVAYHASMYATLRQHKEAWPKHNAAVLKAAVEALDAEFKDVEVNSRAAALRCEEAWFRRAAAVREGGGHPIDKPYQIFLNNVNVAGGTAAVAAAILFLFGLGKQGRRYARVRHAIEVMWTRKNVLNIRQDSEDIAKAKREAAMASRPREGETQATLREAKVRMIESTLSKKNTDQK